MVNPQNTVCCLNPYCPQPLNTVEQASSLLTCLACNTPLTILDNRYRPIKFLGQGSFGRTYLAENTRGINKKDCVIKQLTPANMDTHGNQKAIELFSREAVQLETLGEHPQIPRLLDYFQQGGYLYLVQQYVNGQTLEKLRDRPWNEIEIREFLKNILPVLQFIHDNKVIHRDLKPQNIMYSQDEGNYILIDFGVSKDFASTVHQRGTITGTRGYAAYEQMNEGEASASSDLFSIGATCFYLLTNQDPYYLLLDVGYQWVNRWQTHLPQPLSPLLTGILDKLLQKEKRNRYQSAQEALESLTIPQKTANQGVFWQNLFNKTPENSPPAQPSNTPPLPSTLVIPPSNPNLNTFTFETVKLDRQRDIIQRETRQAEFISFDLGEGITLEMVKIPGGTFIMGSPPDEKDRRDDEEQQEVTLSTFYIGKYLVTQAQWQAIMGNNPSYFNEGGKYPVEQVSWDDCQEFCQKISQKTGSTFRLPAEAEWEYACRAGTKTPFYYGETLSTEVANYKGNYTYGAGKEGIYREKTTEVGTFPPNGFGLYDMHGNLWEWCQDDYQQKPKLNNNNSQQDVNKVNANERIRVLDPNSALIVIDNNSQNKKVLRGGSWFNNPISCRCACRYSYNTRVVRSNNSGFRVVCAVGRT